MLWRFILFIFFTGMKMRKFAYCKVVLATSLVWVMLDMFILLYFSECNKCDDKKERGLPGREGVCFIMECCAFIFLFVCFFPWMATHYKYFRIHKSLFSSVWEWSHGSWTEQTMERNCGDEFGVIDPVRYKRARKKMDRPKKEKKSITANRQSFSAVEGKPKHNRFISQFSSLREGEKTKQNTESYRSLNIHSFLRASCAKLFH